LKKKKLIRALALLLGAAAPAAPALAVPVPPPNEAFAGELAPLWAEYQSLIRTRPEEPEALLRSVDALLAKLPRNSKARAVVLLPRAA
jgi:hypothetical protein